MIVVRNVFQMKFGQAKPAVEAWKQGMELARKHGAAAAPRLLTDVAGAPFYTLVFEMSFASLSAMEQAMGAAMSDPEWQAWYQRAQQFMVGGHREVLHLVE